MAKNENLHKAKAAKNDEFYTQATDIEKEMVHYRDHFRGKTIFCNCDDPTWSEFWKYFHLNFEFLGLKKLISTHYDAHEPTYKMEYEGGNDTDTEAGVKTRLMQNGDFRSEECLELLDQSDIVVTNPPFSMFREYIDILIKHSKKFIIWGNNNAITYKEFFPYLKENKIWTGYLANSSCYFMIPDSYRKWDEKYTQQMNDGHKYGKVPAITVYTNLDIQKRHENIILWKNYSPEEYPHYSNYDGIDVKKISEIPCDYTGIMGVPVTFMDNYNPDQFEIIGCGDYTGLYGSDYIGIQKIGDKWISKYREQGGRGHYTANMTSLVFYDNDGKACNTFKRILIRRKVA